MLVQPVVREPVSKEKGIAGGYVGLHKFGVAL
jgi:hypothetical protein